MGKVKVYVSDENGCEFVFNFMGFGEYFGELLLFDDEICLVFVIIIDKLIFFILYKEDFSKVVLNYFGIVLVLLCNFVNCICKFIDNVKMFVL